MKILSCGDRHAEYDNGVNVLGPGNIGLEGNFHLSLYMT